MSIQKPLFLPNFKLFFPYFHEILQKISKKVVKQQNIDVSTFFSVLYYGFVTNITVLLQNNLTM